MGKRIQYVVADNVTVRWKCVLCGVESKSDVDVVNVSGGCAGHEPDEYCYCSDIEVSYRTRCQCGVETYVSMLT